MKKIEVIEMVQDFLAGGDAPADVRGKYHPQIISNNIATVFKDIVFKTYLDAKNYSDYSPLDALAKKEKVTVLDANPTAKTGRGLLPYPPMQLPNNMGIRQVAPTDHPEEAFAYRENNSNFVFSQLEINTVSDRPYFSVEMNTEVSESATHVMKFGNLPDSCEEVEVMMIVPFEKIDDYDDVAFPPGGETGVKMGVIELLRAKKNEDEINDKLVEQR